jgi:hypothetical protein
MECYNDQLFTEDEEWAEPFSFNFDKVPFEVSIQDETEPTKCSVNSPSHYNQSGIECIDAIEAATGEGFEYYLQGNIMKYLWRYRYKNRTEDLKKAQWYLTKLISVKEELCTDQQ